MTSKTFILLLLLPSIVGNSQPKNEELIGWSENKKLTWADYKGKVQSNSDAAASTATYLGLEYNYGSKGFVYKVSCHFSRTKSWGLHKTDYILAHEQGHFDIAEIFARKLNKELSEYVFNKNSYQEDLKKIYTDLTNEKDAFQTQYDAETNHSINKKKQDEWLTKIEGRLNDLRKFANY